MLRKEQDLFDNRKISILPLIITIMVTIIVELVVHSVTLSVFKQRQESDHIYNATLLSEKITQNYEYEKLLLESLDNELLSVASFVIDNRSLLSNEFLAEIATHFSSKYIYWYSPMGGVLYDSTNTYVGWIAKEGDPIYNFMTSGEDILVEGIRKSTDEDNYYKFVYVRTEDNYFVQVGVNANYVYEIIKPYEYQTIINGFLNEENGNVYAFILDKNSTVQATTDQLQLGANYEGDENYESAFLGEKISYDKYHKVTGKNVTEIVVPIYYEQEIIGLLVVGHSLDDYNRINMYLIILFSILACIIIITYGSFQYIQVLKPIKNLNKELKNYNVNSNRYVGVDFKEKGLLRGVYSTLNELGERIRAENIANFNLSSKIRTQAYTDYLTGLPNRLYFIEEMDKYLVDNPKLLICFLDLNDFKAYNDTKGHNFGDLLLIAVADRLKNAIDSKTIISRYGGDEFLLSYKYEKENEIEKFIERISNVFKKPFLIDNGVYSIDVSMGISISPKDGKKLGQLIRKADLAMYKMKVSKQQGIAFYTKEMDEKIIEERKIVNILKEAIRSDGFEMYYQPQVDINSERIVSLEALLRLKNHDMSPGIFIPIAEQSWLIMSIDRIVIEKVVKQISSWMKEKITPVPVYVNISSRNLTDDTIVDYTLEILKKNGVDSSLFGVELTESALVENQEAAEKILKRFKEFGIKTALDDFGSGYSGINYLTRFNVDKVKFDKKFSDRYLNKDKIEIYNLIIKVASLLGFSILAEGIETKEQVDLLKKTSCQEIQGYYYFRPSNCEVIKKLLQEKK